jgi:hypothetical protein
MHESRDDQCLMVHARMNEIMHLRESRECGENARVESQKEHSVVFGERLIEQLYS